MNFCCLASTFKLQPSKDAETSIWHARPFDTPFWRPAYGHIWWYRWKCEDIVCFFLPLKNVKVCCLPYVFLGSISIKYYWPGNASGVLCFMTNVLCAFLICLCSTHISILYKIRNILCSCRKKCVPSYWSISARLQWRLLIPPLQLPSLTLKYVLTLVYTLLEYDNMVIGDLLTLQRCLPPPFSGQAENKVLRKGRAG